jgi:predicted HAD superfamily Cof-like phosphohydrolase
MSNYTDVVAFHRKYQVPCATEPSLLDASTMNYRVGFLQEELTELTYSYGNDDLEGCADALVDLVYVALGTALMMGLPWEKLWDEVQRANMTKRLAKPDGSDSKRGNPLDVVKPPGWVGPDHSSALGATAGRFNASQALILQIEERRSHGNR